MPLEDDPDHRLARFHIDANMSMAIFNFRERRQRHAEELDHARSIVRGRTFAEQLALERSEVPRYLYESYPFGVQRLSRSTSASAASGVTHAQIPLHMSKRE
jgi:hypothetical protein